LSPLSRLKIWNKKKKARQQLSLAILYQPVGIFYKDSVAIQANSLYYSKANDML
jgi:hypothetical protein